MMPDESALFDEQKDAIVTTGATRAFLRQRFPTLGERLAREARRFVSRRIPVLPWLRPLETAMENLAALPVPAQDRFQRIEALPPGYPIGAQKVSQSTRFIFSQPDAGSAPRAHDTSAPMGESIPMNFSKGITTSDPAGQPLPPHLQQRLQGFVGHGTEPIRVHDDEESHALARARRADAVTIGQHIFFGKDRFRPQEDEGFALLTHEALHVVRAMQPGSAWRRATQAGIQEEEQEAAAVESRALTARRNASWVGQPTFAPPRSIFPAQAPALQGRSALQQRRAGSDTARVSAESTGSTPAQRPMRAASDRSIENGATPPTMPDMDELKRALYRDLMRQIKADLERGG